MTMSEETMWIGLGNRLGTPQGTGLRRREAYVPTTAERLFKRGKKRSKMDQDSVRGGFPAAVHPGPVRTARDVSPETCPEEPPRDMLPPKQTNREETIKQRSAFFFARPSGAASPETGTDGTVAPTGKPRQSGVIDVGNAPDVPHTLQTPGRIDRRGEESRTAARGQG